MTSAIGNIGQTREELVAIIISLKLENERLRGENERLQLAAGKNIIDLMRQLGMC